MRTSVLCSLCWPDILRLQVPREQVAEAAEAEEAVAEVAAAEASD